MAERERDDLSRDERGELDTEIREDTDVHDATGGEGGRVPKQPKVTEEDDLFKRQSDR